MLFLSASLFLGRVFAAPAETDQAKRALTEWSESLGVNRHWDDLSSLAGHSKRFRGALAYVFSRIESGEVPDTATLHLYQDLAALLSAEGKTAVQKRQPAFDDYQQYFEVDVFSLWQSLITNSPPSRVWPSEFKEAYYSGADGAGITFGVRLPEAPSGEQSYPLLVVLNAGPRVMPDSESPFIQVTPSGRGVWGYRSISAYDAMQVIEFMNLYYAVDPDRIYLTGFSAGASGAMQLASSYPDEFAAVLPMVAFGTNLPLTNFLNLPVAIHHGTEDWTSSICNVRVQYERMRKLSCPVILKEYPRTGHVVPKPHEPLVRWLLEKRRDRVPHRISHKCETPDLGRSYWLEIDEFADPHQAAGIKASLVSTDGIEMARIRSENVARFSLDLDRLSESGHTVRFIDIDGSTVSIEGTKQRVLLGSHRGHWKVIQHQEDRAERRGYRAGAAASLYQGEPLLIVYGTGGAEEIRTGRLKEAAARLASFGGPSYSPIRGAFPVVADFEVTTAQKTHCNLILLGTPDENLLTSSILPALPVTIRNRSLEVAGRPPLPLDNQVLSLLHPHPGYPDQLVYIIAPFTNDGGLEQFSRNPQLFLAGSEGFDRISQPDLVVQSPNLKIGRQMQFDKQWNWLTFPGTKTYIPAAFREREALARSYMRIMRKKSGADYALWWGPSDKGMWGYDFNYLQSYDPGTYTKADFHTQRRRAETMIGRVSGAELKDIWERWVRNREIISVPAIDPDALADDKEYLLNIPMDMYIKLGQRERTLKKPVFGPWISTKEVAEDIFH